MIHADENRLAATAEAMVATNEALHKLLNDFVEKNRDAIIAFAEAAKSPMASAAVGAEGLPSALATTGYHASRARQVLTIFGQQYCVTATTPTRAELQPLLEPTPLRLPAPPPWRNARPWLKKKKGRP